MRLENKVAGVKRQRENVIAAYLISLDLCFDQHLNRGEVSVNPTSSIGLMVQSAWIQPLVVAVPRDCAKGWLQICKTCSSVLPIYRTTGISIQRLHVGKGLSKFASAIWYNGRRNDYILKLKEYSSPYAFEETELTPLSAITFV